MTKLNSNEVKEVKHQNKIAEIGSTETVNFKKPKVGPVENLCKSV